jgi:hypothetical protein
MKRGWISFGGQAELFGAASGSSSYSIECVCALAALPAVVCE